MTALRPPLVYDAAHLVKGLARPSSQGLASHVATLVRSGVLVPGDRLPHVRDLADELRVSPATISGAWSLLRKRGLLTGRGKSGMHVSSPVGLAAALGGFDSFGNQLDLRFLFPDVELLPPLTDALVAAAALPGLDQYYADPILPELRSAIEDEWPSEGSAFVVANGSADALWSALHALSVTGDRVLVESPTQPQFLSVIADLGLEPVPIVGDEHGPNPDVLRNAMSVRPVAFFYQPRAQVPTGSSTDERRRAELATIIRQYPQVVAIEYDDLGHLSSKPLYSVASIVPEQTLFIRSFEKSHSPDLRIAVIGGPPRRIEALQAEVRITRQWSSRILQGALAWLLKDDGTRARLEESRATYDARATGFADALKRHSVELSAVGGFCVWVPVLDEQRALDFLSSHGVLAYSGESSHAGRSTPHIRIATSRLLPPYDGLAELVGAASVIAPGTTNLHYAAQPF